MIDVIDLAIQFDGKYLFNNANFKINKNDKLALVGANGTGKSTLLKLLAGIEEPESGFIQRQNNIKIGYLQQEFSQIKPNPLFNEVWSSLTDLVKLENEETEINEKLNQNISEKDKHKLTLRLGEINHEKEELDYYKKESEIKKILSGLGFTEKDFNKNTNEFSGGWHMRIELAKILIADNDLILLDEPTNHLDIDTLQWLINFLNNSKSALLIVSHDKSFLNQVTTKTLEIFNSKINLFNGNYNKFLKFKIERDKQLENEFAQQQQKIKETEKFIERFRYKATKAKQVQSRIKQLEKMELVEPIKNEKEISIRFPEPPRSGIYPVELKNISMSYDSNNFIFENLDFKVERNEKIAFVGPNGAGKTTLAKIIAGKLNQTHGEIIFGSNTIVSYYAQEAANVLEPDLDILETVSSVGSELTIPRLRILLGSFLFSADDVFKKIKVLSGGEKSRVSLAQILLKKANLIILDEPTNHLDESSKTVLKKALQNFAGASIIVSHDIDFLRGLVSKVVEIRNGRLKVFSGDIDYYLEKSNPQSLINSGNELDRSFNSAQNKIETKENKRKEQKRLEAELRQKKYKATKNLINQINDIETSINLLEEKKEIIEKELADPAIFTNPNVAKKKNIEYEQIKSELDKSFDSWTELSAKLEEIENNFRT